MRHLLLQKRLATPLSGCSMGLPQWRQCALALMVLMSLMLVDGLAAAALQHAQDGVVQIFVW